MSKREPLVRLGWLTADCAAIAASTAAAAILRYDFTVARVSWPVVWGLAGSACVLFLLAGTSVGAFRRSHLRGSFDETADVVKAGVITAVMLTAVAAVTRAPGLPRSLPFSALMLSMIAMLAIRFVVRSYRWGRTSTGERDRRAIVYGAGEGGRQLIRALQRDSAHDERVIPVAVIDDDPRKRRSRIEGVRVVGGQRRLADTVATAEARILVVAIPSLEPARLREISDLARGLDLELLVLPPVSRILGPVKGADLRSLNLEDFLGRGEVSLDADAIRKAISGKRVLVTGAGGSIGSELCRQMDKFDPAKLVLLDRDESALHAVQLSLTGRAMLDDGTLALCDIRDPEALRLIFERERPEVVFHAAALKHLTLLEQFPLEAWKSNVLGTLNVLEASRAVGVDTFVNISTDKAANPSCVLGFSKRVAERLTAGVADGSDGRYVSVRFGNVLGSRGSVITAFTAQIERGGPVTVTHPDVERYFMVIPEACQLVLQAAAIGGDGEVMVLDMGEPVRILDLARDLIDLSGKSGVDILFTGLRPGEKLSEELFSPGEGMRRSAHQLVNQVQVPPLDVASVRSLSHDTPESAFEWMLLESAGHTNADSTAGVTP